MNENGRVVTDDNVGPILTGLARGAARGMAITLSHAWRALVDYARGRRVTGPAEGGLFTIQYPEDRLPVPENFRYLPVLIYDDQNDDRILCTSCGICAKVCPPQCIWIVRTSGPDGKPIPEPAEFAIDMSICMSCGYCAEYCPFDAIKMDHQYELAGPERIQSLLFRKQQLLVPQSYYARIHPTDFADEQAVREAEEAKKREKAAAAAAG